MFSDVEDKARRLTILKSLVAPLHLGDEVMDVIQKEVEAAEEAARKAKEAEEAEAALAAEGGDELDLDFDSADEIDLEEESDDADLDLAPMPDAELADESFKADESKTILVEDGVLIEDADDLPTPEEADTERDFTENL